MFKKLKLAFALGFAGLLSIPFSANAAIDLTSITGAVTAGDVVTGVLAIAGVLAVIYATMMAAKKALAFIRGG